nr:DUF2628 domain-containing protein [Rhodoferax sp.]
MTESALSTASPAPDEDVTTTLYRAAIGPVSGGYYLPIFTRFEAADHAGISWNTAASLITLNWLVFRKLWVAALAYVGILVAVAVVVFGIGQLVFQFSDTLMMVLGLGFGLVAFVLPGLFGNALFHTECRKAMSKALVGHANVADARDALLRQASTRRRVIWLAAANAALLLVATLVYLQVAALHTVTVMPQGALDTGQVAVGRAAAPTVAASEPIAPASTALPEITAPQPAASSVAAPSAAATTVAEAPVTAAALTTAAAPEPAVAIPVAHASPPTKTLTKPNTPKVVQPPPKPAKASSTATTDTAAKAFFINVGLFAVPENAARAHTKLLEAQLPSVMKELKSKTRQIRVRVGPFATQQAAEAAAEKIKALQLDASIIQL